MRLRPHNVQVIGDELAIVWNDGAESYLRLPELRRACPCATCGGEPPDALGNIVRPHVTYTPASFRLKSWQMIGGYALQPAWEDGHNTGLYTFSYLRRLAGNEPGDEPAPETAEPPEQPRQPRP